MDYYNLDIKEVFKNLNSDERGLSEEEAENRLQQYGENKLKEVKRISVLELFFNQFKSFLVLILIAAVIISAAIGEFLDAIVILVILIVNAFLGMIQEYKAEKAIEALKKLGALEANVVRGGKEKRILAEKLVSGDIILLNAGDKVPADARLIAINDLHTDEASLTGESIAVKKELKVIKEATIADQKNMVFSSTNVTKGKGVAIVVGTGMGTEIGKIAKLVQEAEVVKTPLQKKLVEVGKFLGITILIICAVVFFTGYLFGGLGAIEMFLAAISLAVAAIPEGLPAIITVSLAFGVQKMVKRNALIRKLPAVETLGSTTLIASDKTGTLTHGKMTVREIYVNKEVIHVTGEGYETEGKFLLDNKICDIEKFNLLLKVSANCNDANLEEKTGDPTELALLIMAKKGNIVKDNRMDEIPFNSEQKYMATFHKDGTYVKGAPEVVLQMCKYLDIGGRRRVLTSNERKIILKQNDEMANGALRVLAMAYSDKKETKDLTFVGLAGMIDPPREEVKDAIARCNKAGIKVLMITGDHKLTAQAIGKEIGLKGGVITGEELDKLSDEEIKKGSIFARVNPEHKVRILKVYEKTEVVAMTGDGVNDAPALKKADIGIAMGINGTDVAKEASQMILTDDNFASIVNAIEEGRGIYDNIRKFIGYLLSSNLGEVLVIFFGIILGLGLPLIAIQILWMNLVTDGLPALALSKEPIDKNVMNRKPRKKDAHIIDRRLALNMVLVGIIHCIGTLAVFYFYSGTVEFRRTMAFNTLVIFQLFNVLNYKSEKSLFYHYNFANNVWLLLAILSSILLQFILMYTPLNNLFGVVELGFVDWAVVFLVGMTVILFEEIRKFFFPTKVEY